MWFRIPTGVRAWIEDVVVDGDARGRGVGEALNRHALDRARMLGAKTVDLTSRPSREAANRLYQRIGFVPRETNVYRFDLDLTRGGSPWRNRNLVSQRWVRWLRAVASGCSRTLRVDRWASTRSDSG